MRLASLGAVTHPRFSLVALDCPDPIELATFYSRLTGMDVEPLGDLAPSEVTWIELINNGAPTIAFQKVDDFVAPTWPSAPIPQQLHIDLDVDDLDTGERLALSLGATKPEFQPGTSFRVYLDPVGHPFCLVSTS
jgi:hypothetical protein